MRRAAFVTLLLAAFLGGCATEEEMAARDAARCESFGFKPDTEAYAHCRLQLYSVRNRRPDVIERPMFPPPRSVIVVPRN